MHSATPSKQMQSAASNDRVRRQTVDCGLSTTVDSNLSTTVDSKLSTAVDSKLSTTVDCELSTVDCSTMKQLSPDDRPREKLSRHGVSALGDNELVALVLGHGSRRGSALALANQLLAAHG